MSAAECAEEMLRTLAADGGADYADYEPYLSALAAALEEDCAAGEVLPTQEEIEEFACGEFTESAPLRARWPRADDVLSRAFDGEDLK